MSRTTYSHSVHLRLQVILSAVDKFTKPFKSAQASNKKLAKTLRQSRQQLKELNNQAKQIDGFKKTKQSLDAANNAYQQATAKVSRLVRELSQAQVKLNSGIASTSRRLQQQEQQQEQQLKRVASQEKRMSAAKNSYQITMACAIK